MCCIYSKTPWRNRPALYDEVQQFCEVDDHTLEKRFKEYQANKRGKVPAAKKSSKRTSAWKSDGNFKNEGRKIWSQKSSKDWNGEQKRSQSDWKKSQNDWKDKPESKSKDLPQETGKKWDHVKTKFTFIKRLGETLWPTTCRC